MRGGGRSGWETEADVKLGETDDPSEDVYKGMRVLTFLRLYDGSFLRFLTLSFIP